MTLSGGVNQTFTDATFVSDSSRVLELEVDYCASVNVAPFAPSYGTHQHTNHPPDVSDRTLTIASVYREAGVHVTAGPGTSVVDDSAPGFLTWNVAELHDALETAFSRYTSTWPNWRMWGLQVGRFDSATLGGIMSTPRPPTAARATAPTARASRRHVKWFMLHSCTRDGRALCRG